MGTHMGTHMGSVNISIRDEVYKELRRRRAEGESFSDVLERLLRPRGSLFDHFGAWADMDPKEWREFQAARRDRQRLEEEAARRRARRDR